MDEGPSQGDYGMPRPKVAKSRRPEAERAAEHYLYNICHCEIHTIRKAIRAKYQSVDFWACDVMGKAINGYSYFAQVTAGQTEAVRTRRRKLEKIPWNRFEFVFVLQLVETIDPANALRKKFYFRVHRLNIQGNKPIQFTWSVDNEACPVPREWFKKLREKL